MLKRHGTRNTPPRATRSASLGSTPRLSPNHAHGHECKESPGSGTKLSRAAAAVTSRFRQWRSGRLVEGTGSSVLISATASSAARPKRAMP